MKVECDWVPRTLSLPQKPFTVWEWNPRLVIQKTRNVPIGLQGAEAKSISTSPLMEVLRSASQLVSNAGPAWVANAYPQTRVTS